MTNRRKILLVDRNSGLLLDLAERCRSIGLEVFTAEDAAAAVAILEKDAPDLICLDDQVPGGDGLTFGEMVVASPDDVSCPVIVLIAAGGQGLQRRSSEMCIYRVQKRPQLWRFLEPVIYELVDIPSRTCRSNDQEHGISESECVS